MHQDMQFIVGFIAIHDDITSYDDIIIIVIVLDGLDVHIGR